MHPFFAVKPPLLLFPFRFFDPIRRRWVRARYVAEQHEIESRYEQWEIVGPPEIRMCGDHYSYFNPFQNARTPGKPVNDPPAKEPLEPDPRPKAASVEEPREEEPALDPLERFLVLVFLRRYVTWCARAKRFAAMEGAAKLFREMRN